MKVKCGRCKHTILSEKGGWCKCPKCGHSQFASLEPSKIIPAKKSKVVPSPTGKGASKAKIRT